MKTIVMPAPEQLIIGLNMTCPVSKQASEKFTTFIPVSDLSPIWGQKQIEPLLTVDFRR